PIFGSIIARRGMSAFTAGETREIVFTYFEYFASPPAGARGIKILADEQDRLYEAGSEENNIFTYQLTSFYPDLLIEDPRQPGGNVNAGEFRLRPDQLKMRVRNAGQTAITSPFNILFQWTDSNNNPVGDPAVLNYSGGLATSRFFTPAGSYDRFLDGESYDFDSSQYPVIDQYVRNKPSGAARLRITLDPDNAIQELDERNNILSAEPSPTVDLAVLSARIEYEPYRLVINVRNNGPDDLPSISGNDLTLYWADEMGRPVRASNGVVLPNAFIVRRGMLAFGAGQEREQIFDASYLTNPPVGGAAIWIKADEQDRLYEAGSEENNILVYYLALPQTTGEEQAGQDEDLVADELAQEVAGSPAPSAQISLTAVEIIETERPGESIGRIVKIREQLGEEVAGEIAKEAESLKETAQTRKLAEKIDKAKDPKVLPGSPLYFFKNSWRAINSTLTFNLEKKTELKLRFANEKILEANKLSDLGKDDQVAKHLKSYEQDLQDAQSLLLKLKDKNQEAAKTMAGKVLGSQLRQQVLVGKFEKGASDENLAEIINVREKVSAGIGQTIGLIQDEEKITRVLSAAFSSEGSFGKPLRNLEVLKAIEEKVPEQAQSAIRLAQENSLQRFKNQFESMAVSQQDLLPDYLENAGGKATAYLKVFDDLKFAELKGGTQGQIATVKQELLSNLGEQIKEAQEKNPALLKGLLSDISGGTMGNLRVIKEMENNFSPELASTAVSDIKKEATGNFQAKLASLTSLEAEEKFIKETSARSADVSQIEIIKEVKESLPQKEKQIAEKLQAESLAVIKTKVAEAQKEKEQEKKEAKIRTIAGDDSKQIETIKEIQGAIGRKAADSLISAQAKNLKIKSEAVEIKQEAVKKEEKKEEVKIPEEKTPVKLPAPSVKAAPKELLLETKQDLTKTVEGDLIYFQAIAVMSSGEKKDVTLEADWQVLGLIGSMAKPGVFRAKLDLSVSELGESFGTVIATWKDAQSGEIFLAKSPVLKIKAKVENETDLRG
ncbi:MAG: DUF5667 domain-containing protein, partial [bacterium]